MTKDKAFEIKELWEEIRNLEYLASDEPNHTLEFLAKRLNEASKINYPNTYFDLIQIEKEAQRYVRTAIMSLVSDLNDKLESL